MTDTEILDWYIAHWPKVAKYIGQATPFFTVIVHPDIQPIHSNDFRECIVEAARLEKANKDVD